MNERDYEIEQERLQDEGERLADREARKTEEHATDADLDLEDDIFCGQIIGQRKRS